MRPIPCQLTIATLAWSLFSMSSPSEARPPIPFEVGQKLPSISLPAASGGNPVSLDELRGRKFILQVFASW